MIYLIRHGQTDWNLEQKIQGNTDIPLNSKGKSDAEVTAKTISRLKIDKIISSDLRRAKETAEIINKHLGNRPLQLDKRLREISFGDLEGICVSDISSEVWEIFNYYPEKLKVEKPESVYNRIKNFFDELDDSEDILIVTHGGVLRMLMYYVKNSEFFDANEYNQTSKTWDIKNLDVFVMDKKTLKSFNFK